MALLRRVALLGRRAGWGGPLPDNARQLLALPTGTRVLAWSSLVGGGWVVATPAALRAILPTGRIVDHPWTDVDHVAWDDGSRMLAVWWVGSLRATPLEVTEGSFLPEVVHERVRSSVVLDVDVDVPGGGTVRVALRKAVDGTLSTQAIPGRGVRLTDPGVSVAVEQARARLRDEAGLPPAT